MPGFNAGLMRRLAAGAGAGISALLVVAGAALAVTGSSALEPTSIADVRVERDGDATVVVLLGLDDPVFTAFQQSEPDRVVVEITAWSSGEAKTSMAVQDGLVRDIALAPQTTVGGSPVTRVEVGLAKPANYQVVPGDEGLVIRVEALAEAAAAGGSEDGDDPWEIDPAAEGMSSADAAAEGMSNAAEESGALATTLMNVELREVGDASVLRLIADGAIGNAETFTLDDPDRLVIDLPGMKSAVAQDKLPVGGLHAQQVRIGRHADRVRVVVDGGDAEEPFASRRVVPAAMGLVVGLGRGEALEQALEQASKPVMTAGEASTGPGEDDWLVQPEALEGNAEMAETETATERIPVETTPKLELAQAAATGEVLEAPTQEASVEIYAVEYDAQADRDRVAILAEGPVDYLVYAPSGDTVVLTLQNAHIDTEAAVRITPEPGGPVSLVTAFEQPESNGAEVRVVLKHAEGLEPVISREGSVVLVDFPRDGSVAATPPVLTTTPKLKAEAAGQAFAAVVPPEAAGQAFAAVVPPEAAGQASAVAGMPVTPVQAPAAMPATAAAALAPSQAAPAAIGVVPPIEVLQEGGLMDRKEYMGRLISMDFKDIEMADVLRLIAEVSDLNVIAGDEVSGRVTIRLVDVPWDQALDVILLTKGLGFMRVGNVLRIAPAEVLRQEEEMRLQERRALEQLEDLIVKLQPVNFANVQDIRGMVSRLLSARGTVDVDKRTNTVIIKDIPSIVDEATALIKAIDTQTPQVLIEAKIVEANLDFSREFGVTWGFGAQPLNDAFDPSSGPRDLGSDAFRLNTTPTSVGNNATFMNPLTAGPTGLFNIAGFLLDEKINLDLQLQAAEVNGDGKVISSPRVVTLDNSQATIEQGVSIPFQTFENGDAQLEFVDAVLKLDVTPHITADRSIVMEVNVSRNAPDDSVFTLTGSPAISKNQVDTETLVKDGQTLVIGGIYVIDKSERQSRVPYLHSIPIIGALFRSNEISDSRKELLIFVTPRVVATLQTAS
ncbi:MAG: type IV pilus secretin PilQ [Myxococcota bacterium]|nr:type IV pilus secretin PilQ [Myxococcota bacterium]